MSNSARAPVAATGKRKQRALQLLEKKRAADAVRVLGKLCKESPDDGEAHYLLGVAHGHTGQFAAAAESFKQAIQMQPGVGAAHCGLGAALRALGRPDQAVAPLREAIRQAPQMAEAHIELAEALRTLGSTEEAAVHYARALERNPNLGLAHFALGEILHDKGELASAVEHYGHAARLNPTSIDALCNQGKGLIYLGRPEEAANAFDRALQLRKDYPEAVAGRAVVHELEGNYRQAYALVASLAQQAIPSEMAAVTYLNVCSRFNCCQEAFDYAERTLARADLPTANRRHILFALAKALDAVGRYDEAFEQASRANQLYESDYDPAAFPRQVDELVRHMNGPALKAAPHAKPPADLPIFIVGMPRSGTSLVEQILASHPQVYGAGELEQLNQTVQLLSLSANTQAGYAACISDLTPQTVENLAGSYLDHIKALSGGALKITDKMPHNFLHLGLIDLLFPGAPIIHCSRNPLDTCLSIYFQHFNANHGYATDLRQIATHYRDYQRLMDHWKTALENPLLDVRYETLVENPEATIRELLDFCGLPWDPGCISFYTNKRTIRTVSYDQVRQPLYNKSVNRWKNYQKHLVSLQKVFGIQS